MANLEILPMDHVAQRGEVRLEQLLLGLHALGAARPPADVADLLEVLVGPGAVERDVLER